MTKEEVLQYEIAASWWASWVGWKWGQELGARYFAWKVNRKWARYQSMVAAAKRLEKVK